MRTGFRLEQGREMKFINELTEKQRKELIKVSKKVDGENYYSILYRDETDGEFHRVFSSNNLNITNNFLKELFIKNNDDTERHAHWIKEKVEDITYPWYRRFCSNCKMHSPLGLEHNYCPNCGCKMDEV